MKVTELKTGKLLDVNECYGARLVEQGKAVLSLPAAEEDSAAFPQRSKNRRESESPNGFSGTARRESVLSLPAAEEDSAARQEPVPESKGKQRRGKNGGKDPSTPQAELGTSQTSFDRRALPARSYASRASGCFAQDDNEE